MNDDKEFREQVSKYSTLILAIYSGIIFIIVNVLLLYVFLYNYKENVVKEANINIYEYEEVDLSYLCQMSNCVYISNNNILYRNSNFGHLYVKLERDSTCLNKYVKILPDVFLSNNFSLLICIKITGKFNGFVVVSSTTLLNIINNVYFYLLSILITINLIIFIKYARSRAGTELRNTVMLQHEGYYKSMMLLTENIHHELNTPLSVINNKVIKLKQKIIDIHSGKLERHECDINESLYDFEMAEASLIQIADLLNRMRPFKDIKKQNNRDLKTVIRTCCDIMSISQHERFDYEIFCGFDDYRLSGEKLFNGELTAILLNFIKNSIDANACNIEFKIKSYDEKNKILHFYIIDDGNGIPAEFQKNIFKENASSKSRNRGAGLYVNKVIINNASGDIILSKSSEKGTIFEIIVQADYIGE
jgi:signal transduction histidine kinase